MASPAPIPRARSGPAGRNRPGKRCLAGRPSCAVASGPVEPLPPSRRARSQLAGRQAARSPQHAGKFRFDKHTHSSSESQGGKRLCCRQASSLPAQGAKTLSGVTQWDRAALAGGPREGRSLQRGASTRGMCFPPKPRGWHGCSSSAGTGREQGLGRSHEAFFCGLWFPGQLNPVQLLSQGSAR